MTRQSRIWTGLNRALWVLISILVLTAVAGLINSILGAVLQAPNGGFQDQLNDTLWIVLCCEIAILVPLAIPIVWRELSE